MLLTRGGLHYTRTMFMSENKMAISSVMVGQENYYYRFIASSNSPERKFHGKHKRY